MKITRAMLSVGALLPLALAGCAPSGTGGSGDSGEIRYWLWDSNQLPAYQQCAKTFEKANPDIKIKIEQKGWDDYWGGLTTAFVSGDAPDVFTNHLSKYGEFTRDHQIEPLDDYIKKDKVDTGAYFPGLADLWIGPDDKRYGLPKDWDTIALFYNKKMARKAGISEAEMARMTWNPKDGGSFEKVLAKLTVDKNGVRGDQPGFDPKNVKTYGFGYDDSGASTHGQGQWSWLAASNGFKFTDKNPWGSKYNYDDPKLVNTISWYRSLISKGYAPPLEEATGGVNASDQYGAGNYAMTPNGDWMISTFKGYKGVDTGIAPLPVGPSGKRASMFNGLADSIWSGSQKKEAAWKWVKFLAGEQCQNIVARQAVVFPARPEATEIAKEAFKKKGVDVTPFTVHVDKKTTFPMPITDKASDITALLSPAFDRLLTFKSEPAPELKKANDQINRLLR